MSKNNLNNLKAEWNSIREKQFNLFLNLCNLAEPQEKLIEESVYERRKTQEKYFKIDEEQFMKTILLYENLQEHRELKNGFEITHKKGEEVYLTNNRKILFIQYYFKKELLRDSHYIWRDDTYEGRNIKKEFSIDEAILEDDFNIESATKSLMNHLK